MSNLTTFGNDEILPIDLPMKVLQILFIDPSFQFAITLLVKFNNFTSDKWNLPFSQLKCAAMTFISQFVAQNFQPFYEIVLFSSFPNALKNTNNFKLFFSCFSITFIRVDNCSKFSLSFVLLFRFMNLVSENIFSKKAICQIKTLF